MIPKKGRGGNEAEGRGGDTAVRDKEVSKR